MHLFCTFGQLSLHSEALGYGMQDQCSDQALPDPCHSRLLWSVLVASRGDPSPIALGLSASWKTEEGGGWKLARCWFWTRIGVRREQSRETGGRVAGSNQRFCGASLQE